MVRLRLYLLPGQYTAKGHDNAGKCCSDSFLCVTCPFFARKLVAGTYARAARGMFGPLSYVQVTSLWPHLKCHYSYDQILDIHFFYSFGHNRTFLDFLPNFNLLQALELAVFGPLFSRIYGRH